MPPRTRPTRFTAALLISLAGAASAAPAVPSGFAANVDLSQLNGVNGLRIGGLAAADFLGATVSSAGDFNGDGVDDVIVAVPYASIENDIIVPQAYVVFGSADSQASTIDVEPIDGINVIRMSGLPRDKGGGYSEVSLASGDINGDKISDIIMGVPYASPGDSDYAGQMFVIFGRDTAVSGAFASDIDLADLDGADGFVINGINATDRLGHAVASAGDFNADKIGDIIIGAPYADPNPPVALGDARTDAGRSFVIFGKNTAEDADFPAVFDLTTLDGTNGLAIDGINAFDRSGTAVASAGDVNGDKIADVIIGAPLALGGAGPGAAYVIFGQKPRPNAPIPALIEIALLDGTNGFTINGIDDGDVCGESVGSAGDINADKIGDIVVGARGANVGAGEAYVIFGRKTAFPSAVNPSLLDGTTGFFVRGNAINDNCGWALAPLGDFNGDKIDDLAVSGRGFDGNKGATFVIFGKNTRRAGPFPSSYLPGSFDGVLGTRFNGGAADDQAGYDIDSAGDFNGDGRRDLLIGAPFVSADTGAAYVVYAPAPEVSVAFEGITALSNPILEDAGTLNLTDLFGPFTLGDTSILDFEIRNDGLAELGVTKLKAPRGFTIATPPGAVVDALDTTPFNLQLNSTRTGNFTGKVSFTTNDADEKKFDFTITWSVVDTLVATAPAGPVIDVDSIIDLNNDLITNVADVTLMLRAISEGDAAADLNDDDGVNADDLVILLASFGAPN